MLTTDARTRCTALTTGDFRNSEPEASADQNAAHRANGTAMDKPSRLRRETVVNAHAWSNMERLSVMVGGAETPFSASVSEGLAVCERCW